MRGGGGLLARKNFEGQKEKKQEKWGGGGRVGDSKVEENERTVLKCDFVIMVRLLASVYRRYCDEEYLSR